MDDRNDLRLTDAEQQTLATYETQADSWAGARNPKSFWEPEFQIFRDTLAEGRVLDVGSGNGRDAELFCDHGYQVTGVDISTKLLEVARRREPRASFVRGSVYELPFKDASFDGVWACASLLHVPKDRIQEALAEIRRVLRPGGTLFVAVKSGEGERVEQNELGPRFFAYWQPAEILPTLDAAGLEPYRWHEREGGEATWLVTFSVR